MGFVAYLALVLGAGGLAYRLNKAQEDFLLAGNAGEDSDRSRHEGSVKRKIAIPPQTGENLVFFHISPHNHLYAFANSKVSPHPKHVYQSSITFWTFFQKIFELA